MNGNQNSNEMIIDCLIECLEQSLNDNEEYKKEIEYLTEINNFYDNIIKQSLKIIKYYQEKEV